MSRIPNEAALIVLHDNVKSVSKMDNSVDMPEPFLLGMGEALGDLTTSPPDDDPDTRDWWLEQYDSGRELVRAVLGLDPED